MSLAAVPWIGKELVPPLQEGEFHFEVMLPEGTPLHATDRQIADMEKIVSAEPGVAITYATVGSRLVAGGASLKTKDENLGQIDVVLADRSNGEAELSISERLRQRFARVPGITSKLGRPSFFSLSTPVEVVFFGEDLDALRTYTLALLPDVQKVPGLADVRASLEAGSPELTVRFDRDRLAAQGLSLDEVSTSCTTACRCGGVALPRGRSPPRHPRAQPSRRPEQCPDIENLVVAERNGVPVALSGRRTRRAGRGSTACGRVAPRSSPAVSGRPRPSPTTSGASSSAVRPGRRLRVAGWPNEEMQRSLRSLMFAFALAIFLVYR